MQTVPLPTMTHPSPALHVARLSPPRVQVSVQLLCVPPTAGGFFSFLPWLKTPPSLQPMLPADIELWGVQLRWTAPWSYDGLVSALTDTLEAQCTAAPLVLCGASLGALLAFGVARELRRRQAQAPLGLVVLAMSAPQSYRPGPLGENWTLDEWRRELRRLGGAPEEVLADATRLERLLRQVRGGLSIGRSFTHREEPPFAFPIAVFAGEADQVFPPPTLAGWKQQTASTCTIHLYPEAGHLDLLQVPAMRCCFLADLMTTVQHWLEGRP